MFRSIKNIFIIILIGFLGTGISIRYSPIASIDIDNINEPLSKSFVSLECDYINQKIINPHTIFISYKSEDIEKLSFYDDYILNGKIYKNDKFYKSVNFTKVNGKKPFDIVVSPDKPYQLSIDLSKEKMMLPDGEYKLVITTNAIGHKYTCNSIDLSLKYKSTSPYVKALNKIPDQSLKAMTLYYCSKDNSIEQLIPITRFKSVKRNIFNSTLKELQLPPSLSTGLSNISPISKFNYITNKNGITYIDLPSIETIYTNPKTAAKAMNSFMKTVGTLPNVGRIKFLVDYNKADTFFNGKKINNSIQYNIYNKAYLAYDSGKRYFLVDCDVLSINNSDDINTKAQKIFKTMQNYEYHGMLNVIPKNVKLVDSSFNDSILTLNFSKEFLTAHDGNENLKTMMIDSILFSFTSIKDVKYISVKVNNNSIDSFNGYNFEKPIARPLYINPETSD
ncbi:GerMN domain-containing protein [Abyssisolibacter fermentans]|uniref:GerMN domain-containing protein n=1 Tax=Abyssisolibacter fermentans TaxID=1766203 RepID=UPI00083069A5|nr:GerMN domain-containing protein [Abyssisolibacter fermentans]